MRRACSLTAILALVVACGSKTGLEVGPPPDGGPFFGTLPCRWSWGLPLEIARGGPFGTLRGAVHGRRDEAVLLVSGAMKSPGVRVALVSTPRVIDTVGPWSADDIAGHRDGWSSLAGCTVARFDADFAPLGFFDVGSGVSCASRQVDPDFIDVDVFDGARITSLRFDEDGTPIAATGIPISAGGLVRDVRTVRGAGESVAAVWMDGDRVRLARNDGATVDVDESAAFGLTDDTLRSAALVVTTSSSAPLRIVRVPFDGEPLVDPLGSAREVPDAELRVVTNETEVLVPLADGRLAIQPLSGTALRFLPAPEPGRILRLRVIMRAGASLGGALYVIEEAGEQVARFTPLVCNR